MGAGEGRGRAAILLAGLLLAWPAAWNGYPLVFADTGTYLGQALLLYAGWDRPVHYSVFLHMLHWRVSLWTVPLAQGLIAAHLLHLVLRVLGLCGPRPLLLAAGLLAMASGLPWLAAQLMPDLFTGLMVLALWLLGFGWDRLARWERPYLLVLAAGTVAVHLAHLPVALGLVLVGGLILRWRGGPAVAGMARMAVPVALAVAGLVTANAVAHGRPAVSPFGAVFVAARLIEDGPALRSLDAHCTEAGWQVCALRPALPMPANDFLWPPEGPLRGVLGGGKAWAAEAGEILRATLAREPGAVAAAMLGNAARQFLMLGSGDGLEAWRGEPGPEPLIEAVFPHELPAYQGSRQYSGALARDIAALSSLHATLAAAGLLALPVLAWRVRRGLAGLALCLFVLAAALGNALVTGGLSGAHERYQGRLAWLFALAPAAVLATQPLSGPSATPRLRLTNL